MWFFAGNKATQSLVEFGGISLDFANDAIRDSFLNALSSNHGVAKSDISFYCVSDNSLEVSRIRSGDSWSLVWSDVSPTGEISGISFSIEDSKKWLQFSADKTTLIADGKDALTVSVTMLNADRQSIDTTFSGDLDIPISTPTCSTKARFVFYEGRSSKMFRFSSAGIFRIGSKMSSYRMDNTLTVEIIL